VKPRFYPVMGSRRVVVGFYRDEAGKVRPITKRRVKAVRKGSVQPRARDFGDNPRIRHSHGEHEKVNLREPWEVRHAIKTGRLRPVRRVA
jgi:hypothetical protein